MSRITTDNQVSEVKDSYIFSHNEDIGGVNVDDSVIGNVFTNSGGCNTHSREFKKRVCSNFWSWIKHDLPGRRKDFNCAVKVLSRLLGIKLKSKRERKELGLNKIEMVSIDNFKDIYYKYANENSPELVFFFGLVPVRWCLQKNIHYDIYT